MSAEESFVSPHRTFRDDEDREWAVWDVVPVWGERRAEDRRVDVSPAHVPVPDRRQADRRHVEGVRVALSPELVGGWLTFEWDDSRRRVAPIPSDWHLLTDEQLRTLWTGAERLPPRRRRLGE